MVRTIAIHPNKFLRRRSREVADLRQEGLDSLITDAIETMLAMNAGGLALIQIGIPLRIIVLNGMGGRAITLFNPRIIDQRGSLMATESCPSLPGRPIHIERHAWIKVQHEKLSGLEAMEIKNPELSVVLQHEIDHLNGVLTVDREHSYHPSQLH